MRILPITIVDLQVNGGWNGEEIVDLISPNLTRAQVIKLLKYLRKRGVSSLSLTFITCDPEILRRNLQIALKIKNSTKIGKAMLLPFHIEGPVITDKGAHDPDWLLDGTSADHSPEKVMARIQAIYQDAEGWIGIMTMAPEVPGVLEATEWLVAKNVVVSSGHHRASTQQVIEAGQAGMTAATHFPNAHTKNPTRPDYGGLGWVYSNSVTAMTIPDGAHFDDSWIALALFLIKSSSHLVFVSDAAPVAGAPSGDYTLFGHLPIRVDADAENPKDKLSQLCGSYFTLPECIQQFYVWCVDAEVEIDEDDLAAVSGLNALNLLRAKIEAEGRNIDDFAVLSNLAFNFDTGEFEKAA